MKQFSLSVLWISLSLGMAAQDDVLPLAPDENQKKTEEKKNQNAFYRVPVGAVFSDLVVPHFDKKRNKVALFTAKKMTAGGDPDNLDAESLTTKLIGEDLTLWHYEKDGEIRSTTTISNANYQIAEEILDATGDLFVRGGKDEYLIASDGGVFMLDTYQVFLRGPVKTLIEIPPKEKPPSEKNSVKAKNLLPLAAAAQIATADPSNHIGPTSEEIAAFEELIAATEIPDSDPTSGIVEIEKKNEEIDERVETFLINVGEEEALEESPAEVEEHEFEERLKELFQPKENRLLIHSDRGFYYDGKLFELIYLGKVVVEGEGIVLRCNQNLKAIFNEPKPDEEDKPESDKKTPKNPEKKKPEEAEPEKESGLAGFGGVGELKQLIANGKVRLTGEQDGKKVFLAGDSAVYDADKSHVMIKGDQVAIITGDSGVVSRHKNAFAIVEIIEGPDGKSTIGKIRPSQKEWVTAVDIPEQKADEK